MRASPIDIDAIGIVVPARNEELRLPRCLTALETTTRLLWTADDAVPRVRVIVVVDGSTDGTLAIATDWPGVEVLVSAAGRVGAARSAGAQQFLRTEADGGTAPERVWIASTDADSAVPVSWLSDQLAHARSGVELLLGTVRPDPQELADGLLAAWRLRHLISDGHPHVHGANLGVRGDSYLAAGGFPDVATHEDVLLAGSIREAGGLVLSTGSSPVLTSGRTVGRAPEGMARYLRELGQVEMPLEA